MLKLPKIRAKFSPLPLLVAVSAGLVQPGFSAVLYVDGGDSGSDAGECAEAGTPCKTISYALTKAEAEGDVESEIRIAKGTYVLTEPLPVKKSVHFKGGYSDDFKSKANTPSGTVIDGKNVSQLFNVTSSDTVSFDSLTLTGVESADADSSVIHSTGAYILNIKSSNISNNTTIKGAISASGATITISNSKFTNNKADFGAALNLVGGSLSLGDVLFDRNESTGDVADVADGGGALYLKGVDARLTRLTFQNNIAKGSGSSIMVADGSTINLINATFYNNAVNGSVAESRGGAIGVNSSNVDIVYSTFYKNKTASGHGGAVAVWGSDTKTVNFFGNLFLANAVDDQVSNLAVKQNETKVVDEGSNIFGFADDAGLTDFSGNAMTQMALFSNGDQTYEPKSKTLSETDIKKIIVDVNGPKNNGGIVPSIKIVKNGPAMNQIDSANAPFYGIGKTCDYAFTSIQQAHSAMKVFTGYEAGDYFFELDKADAEATGNCEAATAFKTQVDKDGWVLVVSGNKAVVKGAAYDEVTSLSRQSDSILAQSIVTNEKFVFDTVRIKTPESAAYKLHMVSNDQKVVNAVKAYTQLPNTSPNDDVTGQAKWLVLEGASFVDGATCKPAAGLLSESVYHACGDADGLVWVPKDIDDVIVWNDDASKYKKEDLDLWVRSSSDYCNGTKTNTDARGMPRVDFQDPDDPRQAGQAKKCDIGAFEYNDGYRIDCHDEDGSRHENQRDAFGNPLGGTGICIGGDLTKATPKVFINNIGSIHFGLIFVGILVLGLRLFRFFCIRRNACQV